MSEQIEHYDDGKRQAETASYEGVCFECGCGERFVHYCDLLQHIKERHEQTN